jgi:hypothetical protein
MFNSKCCTEERSIVKKVLVKFEAGARKERLIQNYKQQVAYSFVHNQVH